MPSKYTTPHTKPPSKKQQLLKEFTDRYPHYILKCNLLGRLFLFGGLLSTLEIDIFRMTFISVYIEKYGQVYIETKKGLWGFDIITNKTLIEGQW